LKTILPLFAELKPELRVEGWWVPIRLGLIWLSFGLMMGVTMLTFFTLLGAALLLPAHWFDRGTALFASAMLTFSFLAAPLYKGAEKLIDHLFFLDTATFQKQIDAACQRLPGFDRLEPLRQFLTEELPPRLQVEHITLQANFDPITSCDTIFALEMGRRFLGTLSIGPKRSGRTFNNKEKMALRQLRKQLSLVLSAIQLAQAREMAEKADELKSHFLTNVSHQLRTPLNNVINLTGLVVDGAMGPVNEEQEEFLSRAVRGSEHLMKLLDEILDITKIETGQLSLRPEPLDLRTAITEVVPLVEGMLKDKPVELIVELSHELPLLQADRMRVHQILLNLLSNAAKFTKAGRIKIRAWATNRSVLVSVEDSGIGIAEQDIPLVFENYKQAATSYHKEARRRSQLGTGLGMPITRALVELHGGHIWVESEVGCGSTFTFSLPLTPPQKNETSRPQPSHKVAA
jgi:signal transduction histidine kinase